MDTNPEHDDIISELPTFYENPRSFYRSHNKETPKLPITRTDIQLEGKWTQFFIADDGNADKIIMFTTAHNLTNLISADIIYSLIFFFRFRFFSAKLVRTITFLSFDVGQ
jgi:phosphomannomutase